MGKILDDGCFTDPKVDEGFPEEWLKPLREEMGSPPGGDHGALEVLIGSHCAGWAVRPEAAEVSRWLHAAERTAEQRRILQELFGSLDDGPGGSAFELHLLTADEELTIRETASLLRECEVERESMTRWINGYADGDAAGRRTLPDQEAAARRMGCIGTIDRHAQASGAGGSREGDAPAKRPGNPHLRYRRSG